MTAKPFKRALLLINPHAKRGRECYDRAVALLHERGFELLQPEGEGIEAVCNSVLKAGDRDVNLVIVGGGDGSINAILNALVAVQLPLGVLPLGTANSFAKTLNIPRDLTAACDAIATGILKPVDLGCVNGQYFLNTASLGLSVAIVRGVDSSDKRRWGSVAYFVESLRQFWGAQPFPVYLDSEEIATQIRTFQIVVGNGYYFGGGMIIAPDSSITNRQLHFASIEVRHWSQLLCLAIAARRGRHVHSDRVRSYYCDRLNLQTSVPIPINADGEKIAQTPAYFEIRPRVLSVIIPRSPNSKTGF